MIDTFWVLFFLASLLKILLIPSYHSTDFEVHRNWLAVTYSLPLKHWYYDETSPWTLDYPPFFSYFEWALAKIGQFVEPEMLSLDNINYISPKTKLFQRLSVVAADILYAFGAQSCLKTMGWTNGQKKNIPGAIMLLFNVGLVFIDHIHFQYNGFLFGILLLSLSFMLEERFLMGAFTFSVLLNFKHIFLYIAPAFVVYLLKFYLLESISKLGCRTVKLIIVGLTPFFLSFAPFKNDLPQVFGRLFPFKRGLTHAYWAPNFWALYNGADKFAGKILKANSSVTISTTSGLVRDFEHEVLPSIRPLHTFILTLLFMAPVLIKLFFSRNTNERRLLFLRSIIICGSTSFMFGWHVHEKAILLCLIPLSLTSLINKREAKYLFFLSFFGYFSLFPLLFEADLIIVRYSLYLCYMLLMWIQLLRIYTNFPSLNNLEILSIFGLAGIPIYEHVLSPLLGVHIKMPFMPLLLTSIYCGLGVTYFYIGYYYETLFRSEKLDT